MSTHEASVPGLPPHRFRKFAAVLFGFALCGGMVYVFLNQVKLTTTDRNAPIEHFPAAVRQQGLMCEAPREAAGVVTIAHERTFEVVVDDKPVWLIYFDPFDPGQADARKLIQHDGTVEINGHREAARVRDAVAIAGYEGHPDEKKLLAAFDKFLAPGK